MARAELTAQASAAPAHGRAGRLEWGHLRFFLELVRAGSLSRAASRLGVDRNTVGRRVAALEAELGLPLFERGPQGWSRTAAGDSWRRWPPGWRRTCWRWRATPTPSTSRTTRLGSSCSILTIPVPRLVPGRH